jgi:hypothetical protein
MPGRNFGGAGVSLNSPENLELDEGTCSASRCAHITVGKRIIGRQSGDTALLVWIE